MCNNTVITAVQHKMRGNWKLKCQMCTNCITTPQLTPPPQNHHHQTPIKTHPFTVTLAFQHFFLFSLSWPALLITALSSSK